MKKVKVLFLMMVMCFAALNTYAQNIIVKGTITDATNGAPVPFASVVVKGTSVWTTSQSDGTYEIESPANGVISVAILGYAEQTMKDQGPGYQARYEATWGFRPFPQSEVSLSNGVLKQNAGWTSADSKYSSWK
jgi:hypothetical protein